MLIIVTGAAQFVTAVYNYEKDALLIRRYSIMACVAISLAAGVAFSAAVAEEASLESLERSRDSAGALYPGKDLLADVKRALLSNNVGAARSSLERARKSYGQAREIILMSSLLDAMEHNYRGALKSLGALRKGDAAAKEQAERFRKAEKDVRAIVRSHGRNYAASLAVPADAADAAYLPDRNLFVYAAGGVLYRQDTRGGARTVAGRPGAGRTFGMSASYAPEMAAVAVKTDGRYVIRVFSETQPAMASDLEKKIAASANNITPYLSMDGQTFLFASDRSSSRGGFDIYFCSYSRGAWSAPVNAGSMINTGDDEINPWLHADSDTLYYSSGGRNGFGGLDIFGVRLSAGTRPVNLGLPINDIFDQSLPISLDLGGGSIYQAARGRVIRMPVLYSVKAPSMRFIHGKITLDRKRADKAVPIKIDTNEGTYGVVESLADGHYSMALPNDRDFILIPASPGYLLHTEYVEKGRGRSIESVDFNLPKVYRGMKMQYIVNFDSASADIPNREKGKLKELVRILHDNPHIKFEISGHSSGLGTQKRVERISKLRVAAIMDYLLESNINPRRLEVKAYGGEKKVIAADQNLAAQLSRRVEINVVDWDENLTALSGGGLRARMDSVSDELSKRRRVNFSIPGYVLGAAALACFGTGGYYTYKSLDAKAEYEDLASEWRSIPLSSWKVQAADSYQRKMDSVQDDYDTYRKYSIYAYAAGGTLAVASIIFLVSDWFNRATIRDLEKEAETIQRMSFDFKISPRATELAFSYRF